MEDQGNIERESHEIEEEISKVEMLRQDQKDIDEECLMERECINVEREKNNVQEDMLNMFASVWVKIEVDDEKEDGKPMLEPNQNGCLEDGMRIINSTQFTKPKKRYKETKILKCPQCDYTTIYKNCLKFHLIGHGDSKPFSCTICEYTTKYPTALNRHMMIKHQDTQLETPDPKSPQMYKCAHCDYTSFYKWNLNAHKRKHLAKTFKCSVPDCGYETAYRHNLAKHGKKHDTVEKNVFYKCDKCPFMTRFDGHISRHLAKIHNEVAEDMSSCDLCDFSTKVRWRLNIHKQRSRQENLLKCTFCDFETYYRCESKKHNVRHYKEMNVKKDKAQEISQKEPVSLDSDKDFDTDEKTPKYTLDPDCLDWNSIQVLESDDKEKPFQCHMCNYTARFKASVQRHFQRHHTGSRNKPYKCVNCDFSTKTKDQIALHNKRSKSDVVLYCNSCDFVTKFKCQFAMHQKCHYDNKCPKCDYTCKHKYELQKHFTMTHLGEGLKCQYCDYKAARKDSLLCHETIHTGMKPFKCEHCDYMSVRKCLLNNHMKRYHSEHLNDVTVISADKIESLKIPVENMDLQDLDGL